MSSGSQTKQRAISNRAFFAAGERLALFFRTRVQAELLQDVIGRFSSFGAGQRSAFFPDPGIVPVSPDVFARRAVRKTLGSCER